MQFFNVLEQQKKKKKEKKSPLYLSVCAVGGMWGVCGGVTELLFYVGPFAACKSILDSKFLLSLV